MPYVQPAGVTAGTTITEAWGDSVAAAFTWLANPPACRVYHNANQSIPNNTETTVAFNSERYDTATLHDTVTNNSRLTIPAAGLYLVSFSGEMTAGADYTWVTALIRLGGAGYIASASYQNNAVSAPVRMTVSTVYKFAAAQYVEVRIYQVNGAAAARNLNVISDHSPEFSATWIGLG